VVGVLILAATDGASSAHNGTILVLGAGPEARGRSLASLAPVASGPQAKHAFISMAKRRRVSTPTNKSEES
jgi:hypothetical protein